MFNAMHRAARQVRALTVLVTVLPLTLDRPATAQCPPLDPTLLQDVTASITLDYTGTRWNRRRDVLQTVALVDNPTAGEVLGGPMLLVIDSISTPTTTLANADGTLPDGRDYRHVPIAAADCLLMPGESADPVQLQFANPSRQPFSFVARVLGTTGLPPECTDDADCVALDQECLTGQCIAGECQAVPIAAGTICNDSNACTSADACDSFGNCLGQTLPCDDNNNCTTDSCGPASGCQHIPDPGQPCDDTDLCTMTDTCTAQGDCVGVAVTCDDANPCTSDNCDPAAGCWFQPDPGLTCDDNNACTMDDQCDAAGQCDGLPLDCDDANPCTLDSCDPSVGCVHQPDTGSPCDDLDACTVQDACDAVGLCVGAAVICDDGNECTLDDCDAATGCFAITNPGAGCDDADPCTINDTCQGDGSCSGTVEPNCGTCTTDDDCDDGNPCTTAVCDALQGCLISLAPGAACDDGDICTANDVCDALGTCSGAAIPGCIGCELDTDCDDGDVCTTDTCDGQGQCIYGAARSAPCDDGDACTTADVCDSNAVCAGAPVDCDDADPCSLDTCDSMTGCLNIPDPGAACDDGDPCTITDTCEAAGTCAGVPLACDDGEFCTGTETCNAGVCTSGGNPCAVGETCDEATASCVPTLDALIITLQDPRVGVGRSIAGTITLPTPAPVGGVDVALAALDATLVDLIPSIVPVAAGDTTASFLVDGLVAGSTQIVASASGFSDGMVTIIVTNDLIVISDVTLAPGQTLGLPLSLTSPAPAGGLTVTLLSDLDTVATIDSSVTIPAGQLTATNPQATGGLIGTATIAASAPGFAPDTATVTVTLDINLDPDPLTVQQSATTPLNLTLSSAAPAGGLGVTLTVIDPNVATAPAQVQVPAGQTAVQVPITGGAPGTTQIEAGAAGVATATATLTVTPAPPITVADLMIGENLQATPSIRQLGAPAPAGNLTVTLTSLDPTRVLFSTDALQPGSPSIAVVVPAGQTGLPVFFVHGLADQGTADYIASAPGYATGAGTVQLTPSGFVFSATSPINTTALAAPTNLVVTAARLNPATLAWAATQAVRGGFGVDVDIALDDGGGGIGVLLGLPLTFSDGVSQRIAQFDPQTAGNGTLTVVTPAGFATPANQTQRDVTVTASGITSNLVPIGADLQAPLTAGLQAAPPDTRQVKLDNSVLDDPRGLALDPGASRMYVTDGATDRILRANLDGTAVEDLVTTGQTDLFGIVLDFAAGRMVWADNQAGVIRSAGLSIPAGESAANRSDIVTLYSPGVGVHGLAIDAAGGMLYWTMYNTARIQRAPLDGSGPVETLVTANAVTGMSQPWGIAVDPTGGHLYWSEDNGRRVRRAGLNLPPGETADNRSDVVELLSSTAGFAGMRLDLGAAPPVMLIAGVDGNRIHRAALDGSDERILTAAGLSGPADVASDGAGTVYFTERFNDVVRCVPLAGNGVTVTATSDCPDVRVSLTTTSLGTAAAQYHHVETTLTQIFHVQVIGDAAACPAPQITVSAPGYLPQVQPVTITPSGFVISGPTVINTDAFAPDRTLNIASARLDPTTLNWQLTQLLRPDLGPLAVDVVSSDPAVGELTISPVLFDAGATTQLTAFDPINAGTTTLSVPAPAGFDLPGNSTSIVATVTAAPITLFDSAVGEDLLETHSISLGTAPPSLIDTLVASPDVGSVMGLALDTTSSPMWMYFVDDNGTAIRRATLDGAQVEDLVTSGLLGARHLALDLAAGMMFWTEQSGGRIRRAGLTLPPGETADTRSDIELVYAVSAPWGLALDPANGDVYWTRYSTNEIQRGPLDGSGPIETLVTANAAPGLSQPRGVALDVAGGVLFWTEDAGRRVRRAGLNLPAGATADTRTDVVELLSVPTGGLGGMTLDMADGRMYFANSDSGRIHRARLDGTELDTLSATQILGPRQVALDAATGHVLWAEQSGQRIRRMPLSGNGVSLTLAIGDPTIATVSTDPTMPGSASVTLRNVENSLSRPIYIHGLDQTAGATTLTAAAPGYATMVRTVDVHPSGFILNSPSNDFSTTTFSSDRVLQIAAARLSPTTAQWQENQALRPGVSAAVEVTSSVTTVGLITSSPVVFGGTDGVLSTAFDPLNAGQTVIAVTGPPAFDVPANFQQLTATVTAPDIALTDVAVGRDLQVQRAVSLMVAPPVLVEDILPTTGTPRGLAIDAAAGRLYVIDATSGTLERAALDGTNPELLITGLINPDHLALDVAAGMVYWAERSAGAIRRAGMDIPVGETAATRTDVETLYTGISSPSGVAHDAAAGMVYWTQFGNRVQRGPADGSGPVEDLVTGLSAPGLSQPGGLALDVAAGLMYWVEDGGRRIRRAGLNIPAGQTADNRTDVVEILSQSTGGLAGITLDPAGGRMYYTDFDGSAIRRADLDGTNVEPLVTVQLSSPVGIALHPATGHVYFTNAHTGFLRGVQRAPEDGQGVDLTVEVAAGALAALSADAEVVGGTTLTFPNVQNTSGRVFYVQGLALGGTTITAQAAGYTPRVRDVLIDPAGFIFNSPSSNFSIAANAADRLMNITAARLNPTTLNWAANEAVRAGVTVTVNLASSVPAVGDFTVSSLVFDPGVGVVQTAFDPMSAGVTVIEVLTPAGFSMSSNFNPLTVTVTP